MLRRSSNNKSIVATSSSIKISRSSAFSVFPDADVLRSAAVISIPQEQELLGHDAGHDAGRNFRLQPKQSGQGQEDDSYCRPVPIRVHNGHDVMSSSTSPRLPKKVKTIMCENLHDCKYYKRTGQCHFAHSRDELRRFTLEELKQHKSGSGDEEYDFLSHPCLYAVSLGNCAYGAHCRFLHDPRIEDTSEARPTCRKVQKRASISKSRECNPAFVDSHYFDTRNPLIQDNPLVQTSLWEMRGGSGDDFVETCNLLANKIDDKSLSSLFKLPFHVQDGKEKLSIEQKMAIALLMRQKSKFSESNSHQSYRSFTFSNSASPGKYLDGKAVVILQRRTILIKDGGGVQEVPDHSYSVLDDIVTTYEVVFDTKGANKCNHSLWFDADFEANNQDHVNKVHSLPYVFLEPICKEGDELHAEMMKEFIAHSGSFFGPKYNDLRKKFNSLKLFHNHFTWPKPKVPEDAATTRKPMDDHVTSPYVPIVEGGGFNVGQIWESFAANLASTLRGDGEGDTVTLAQGPSRRLAAFRQMTSGQHSVYSSSWPKLRRDENIADFLSDYSVIL